MRADEGSTLLFVFVRYKLRKRYTYYIGNLFCT